MTEPSVALDYAIVGRDGGFEEVAAQVAMPLNLRALVGRGEPDYNEATSATRIPASFRVSLVSL